MSQRITKFNMFAYLWLLLLLPFSLFSQYAVGDTAANFTLSDINGNTVSLSDFLGDMVVINFFRTT